MNEHSLPRPPDVDPVIAAMAAAVAYGGEKRNKEVDESADASRKLRARSPKLGAKKRNWCWNWFVQDSSNKNAAVCDYCGRCVRRLKSDRGSPKKLLEHLNTHKITPKMENRIREQSTYSGGVQSFYEAIQKRHRQRSLLDYGDTSVAIANDDDSSSHYPYSPLSVSLQTVQTVPSQTSKYRPSDDVACIDLASKTIKFLLENRVNLKVIFSSSWGDLIHRPANPHIDEFLIYLESIFTKFGERQCMQELERCAALRGTSD
ncbi:LAMI_0D08922g1_1 [Lachancea mirantina]|uniref:LAMI_0D08922g1_1 n=1 Tax=Lachancea mirantina TaxID=1230905 RepID=A0A1G4JDH1_9SACH|nr:LAMI_0D08922g1_1 [Lachancea mirantina]